MAANEISVRIVAEGAQARAEFGGVANAARALSSELKNVRGEALQSLAREAGAAKEKLAGISGGIGALTSTIGRMGHIGLALSLIPQYAGYAKDAILGVAKAMTEAALEASRLKQTYEYAFGGMAAGARNLEYVKSAASSIGVNLREASAAYGKLAAAATGTALEGEKTRAIFEAVSKASMVMGLSAQETSGALLAISQMISKGTVQAEELRGQLGERIPGAFQIAARAMGVTTQELGKMLEQGQIVATDFLPKFAAELERSLGDSAVRAADGLQASLNRLENAWESLKQSFVSGADGKSSLSGIAKSIADAMDEASQHIDRIARDGSGLFARFFMGVGSLEMRILAGLFGVASPSGEGVARSSEWMRDKMAEIDRLQKIVSDKTRDIYTRSSAATDLRIAREEFDQAFRANNAKARQEFALPSKEELARQAQETASSIEAGLRARQDLISEFVNASSAKQRKALDDLARRYKEAAQAAMGDEARMKAVVASYVQQRDEILSGGKKPKAAKEKPAEPIDVFGSGGYITRDKEAADAIRASFEFENWAWNELAKEAEKAREASRRYDEALKNAAQSLYAATDAGRFDAMTEKMDLAYEAFQRGYINQDQLDAINAKLMETGERLKEQKDIARELGMSFSSAFEDAIVGGRKFSDVLKGLAMDIARITLRKNVTEPIANAIGSFNWGSLFKFNADGGVYASPSLSAYSGKVVDKPTFFAFARGAGVMGEAGPEAILPLKRGPDGKLGVQSVAQADGDLRIEIINRGAHPVRAESAATRLDARGSVVSIILDDLSRNGPVAQGLASRFGLRGQVA